MAKGPKAAAKPKASKKKTAAVDTAPQPKKSNALSPDEAEQRALFIGKDGYLEKVRELRAKVATSTSNLRSMYKKAKAHGFEKKDFDYAFDLEDAEKEAVTKARIARNLTIARYMGSSLGNQLDFFLEPDRTPAVENAYTEGQTDSAKGLAAKPGYDPSTPQHAEYMKGYHDETERRVKSKDGIGKLHPEVVADEVEKEKTKTKTKTKTKAQQKADAAAFEKPADAPVTSGVAVSRSAFLAQQRAAKEQTDAESESAFAKKH